MLINQYEVDFLINKQLIVEYNGHHHYSINSQKMAPTRKELWRIDILKKRKFIVCSIPYYEWKRLKLF